MDDVYGKVAAAISADLANQESGAGADLITVSVMEPGAWVYVSGPLSITLLAKTATDVVVAETSLRMVLARKVQAFKTRLVGVRHE